ncbi:hypothetical protein TUBRATIS_18060 [Tubulinosema ratisbonensis]|uniref:Uncharacterized protein n=1 Tax=Tubulinosema ratisbonensis TaxID=291195 RepID=A0A437AKL4_9MICR|nr:hypothetical protein TUBRATIS_18060 [Tubulinosema ratisbonensis]
MRGIFTKLKNKNILIRLLDGTPLNGTPKFYNFFGVLDDNYGIIQCDLSINMCHYPINVLKSHHPSFYNCHAWFSGHFHTFFKYGDINKKSDKLESVLKDFYSNSVYRIIGVYKNNYYYFSQSRQYTVRIKKTCSPYFLSGRIF